MALSTTHTYDILWFGVFGVFLTTIVTCNQLYQCRDAIPTGNPPPTFTISCLQQSGYVINILSAVIGYSDRYNIQSVPPTCPWTGVTNSSCSTLGLPCGKWSTPACANSCYCTYSLTEMASQICNGQTICLIPQNNLVRPGEQPLCMNSTDANFIVVNYTCNVNLPTTTTSGTTTSFIASLPGTTSRTESASSSSSTLTNGSLLTSPITTVRQSTPLSTVASDRTSYAGTGSLSPGAVAGIVIGSVACLLLIGILAITLYIHRGKLCARKKSDREQQQSLDSQNRSTFTSVPSPRRDNGLPMNGSEGHNGTIDATSNNESKYEALESTNINGITLSNGDYASLNPDRENWTIPASAGK